jgi:polysaccharide chain length determinant protein (PEP-CTERM system associated)
MADPKPLDIRDYIQIALRRKWYIIIPLICGMVISYGYYKYLPKVYRASTLILVQPQRVPEEYVRATITDSVVNRLNTIGQEILSRTRLEKVIQEFNLYPDLRNKAPMEEIVERIRKAIEVKVQDNPRNERARNSFSISYEGTEPKTVMMVTNKLASMFIEENLKVRESQAEGTSEFLIKEVSAMEEQLKKKEHDIRNFKERNMGQLPQQLDANLRILERLQQQLQTTSENMRATEDRSVLLQNQIEMLKKRETAAITRGPRGELVASADLSSESLPQDPLVTQLNALKRDLANAQSKYTESHPDVIDLKKKIAALEPQLEGKIKARQESIKEENLLAPIAPILDPATQRLLAQYTGQFNEAQLEVRRLREEIKGLKQQIAFYERRIEETPRREQELTLLARDYDLLKANYQSLLDKKIQAQMAENLERKQQGEQFKILDLARIPEKPIKPDRNRILLIGVMMGLMAGLGLTWFRESMDRSFHSVSDLEVYLGIPVIATVPNLKEEQHVSGKRKAISGRRTSSARDIGK